MLYAIDQNKAGRNITSAEVKWTQLFSRSEDSFTSSVIGTLLYLPENLLWTILRNATGSEFFPATEPDIEWFDFWPSWDATDTNNKIRVEPDVFIRTSDFDLIIEAKVDGNPQTHTQWENECIAYLNEYGKSARRPHFIALGGIMPPEVHMVSLGKYRIDIMHCTWQALLDQVEVFHRNIISDKFKIEHKKSILRILEAIMLAFRIHHFYAIRWMDELPQYGFVNSKKEICFTDRSFESFISLLIEKSISPDSEELFQMIKYE